MLTIGQRLKKEREARYLTIEKASEETRIRIVFLRALEADDYSVMPSAAQGRGFLRNYAAYLEINIDEVIAEMQRNAPPPQEVSGPLPQVNLLETELPSLSESDETTPAWLLRLRAAQAWFFRPKQTESTLEEVQPVVEEEKPAEQEKNKIDQAEPEPMIPAPLEKKIEEQIAEAQDLSVEAEQATVESEAKPSLFSKLLTWLPTRKANVEVDPSSEITENVEKEGQKEKKEILEPSLPADIIFLEIGKQLRERREFISLTPEEVERHTKLRVAYVKALEEGAFDKLPSTVQTRGMLTNYATFLDMDTDKILLRYADALQARRREKYSETPREKIQTEVKAAIPLLRGFIAGDLIFGVVMISVLLALGMWGIGRVIASQAEADAQPTSASIVDILGNIPEVTTTPTLLTENDVVSTNAAAGNLTIEAPTISLDANVVVVVYSVERAFVRIAVDDEVVFEGRIPPFETQQYEAVEKIEILSGNAAALRITYNGRDLGLMGNVGAVANHVYTISGVVAPTTTPTPTATNTPLVSATPTVTITSTRTPTPETPAP
jgi:cytoskeleton protein RodZ